MASATFTATGTPGAPDHLTFAVQPSDAAANTAIAPAIEVAVHDVFENLVTSYVGTVALAIDNDAGGTPPSTLTGGAATAVVNGIATFSGVSIDQSGSGFTLKATAGLLTLISAAFNIL
jgi:hypothetical protein